MKYTKKMFGPFSLSIILLALVILVSGCKKKEEQPEPKAPQQVEQTQPKAEEPPKVEEPKEEKVPSIEGVWKGTFYNKSMTMLVAKQEGKDFTGETTVNWAKPLTMKIKGSFDPKELTMKFVDQSTSKDAGSYEGTLSADLKTFTGKFTLNSGGRKFDVKLSLQ